VNILASNYGFSKKAKPDQRECSEQTITYGDSKSAPFLIIAENWKDTHEGVWRKMDLSGINLQKMDEWTYALGANSSVRILILRNSSLIDIKTGGYRYEKKQRRGAKIEKHYKGISQGHSVRYFLIRDLLLQFCLVRLST
jgi:hypothetical protein